MKIKNEIINGIEHKRCCTCKMMVPISMYNKNRGSEDGLTWACRTCTRARYHSNKPNTIDRNIPLICRECQNTFYSRRSNLRNTIPYGGTQHPPKFCSKACHLNSKKMTKVCKFANCSNVLQKNRRIYCSKECYRKDFVPTSFGVSKLEKYMQNILPNKYPQLDFLFNRRDIVGLELDIYIPTLGLAFELNGKFHYEQVFKTQDLRLIQNKDRQKYTKCIEKGISLCVIDTTKQKTVTDKSSQQYLKIVTDIIDETLLEVTL